MYYGIDDLNFNGMSDAAPAQGGANWQQIAQQASQGAQDIGKQYMQLRAAQAGIALPSNVQPTPTPQPKPATTNWTPWLIGGAAVLLLGGGYLFMKRKKSNNPGSTGWKKIGD